MKRLCFNIETDCSLFPRPLHSINYASGTYIYSTRKSSTHSLRIRMTSHSSLVSPFPTAQLTTTMSRPQLYLRALVPPLLICVTNLPSVPVSSPPPCTTTFKPPLPHNSLFLPNHPPFVHQTTHQSITPSAPILFTTNHVTRLAFPARINRKPLQQILELIMIKNIIIINTYTPPSILTLIQLVSLSLAAYSVRSSLN